MNNTALGAENKKKHYYKQVHIKNRKFNIKKAGFIRPASTFYIIQLSNSRVTGRYGSDPSGI